jgi:anti-anti-sigma regulatory factor
MQTTLLPIDLPSEIGVPEAEALKERLLNALRGGSALTLDGSSVRRIGAAGLQVLLAFAIEQGRAGQRLNWSEASPALRECARCTGLDRLLALSEMA